MKTTQDPDTYARMSVPRSHAEAEQISVAFYDELRALREKHGVRDMVYAYTIQTHEPDPFAMCGHIGDSAIAPALAALVYGQQRAAIAAKLDEFDRLAMGEVPPKSKKAAKR